ncbi:uncharacterized protein K02A2.6-like [Anneissia japonica]|uniref:uncharacterized protein K02A2.6-like n=1 Tax=Anneissia japonica TaxID=1529436 RepID=UPI0014254EA1|nr:uncharacterized protein K02A2.6-like [Anneissia japonica]
MFLIVVDAFSKWPEAVIMSSTTSEKNIEELRSLFSRYGLPKIVVSDNGPQLTSHEFAKFMKENGIIYKFSCPGQPATNGQAERFVQTMKQGLKASKHDCCSINTRLSRFLLAYRNSEHNLTKQTPAQLFMKRPLRSRLDILRPNLNESVRNRLHNEMQKSKSRMRVFEVNDLVYTRDFRGKDKMKWSAGVIVKKLGPLRYQVSVGSQLWLRHADQIMIRYSEPLVEKGELEEPEVPDEL